MFRCIALIVVLFGLVACASGFKERNGVVEIYGEDSVLVERANYADGLLDGERWFSLNDSVSVSQEWQRGNLVASDTFYVETPGLYRILPEEKTLVNGVRVMGYYGGTALNAGAASLKSVGENAPAVVESIKGNIPGSWGSWGDLAKAALDKSSDVLAAVAQKAPLQVDSNRVNALVAGFVRGSSLGYQETVELVTGVGEAVPELAQTVWTTTPQEGFQIMTSAVKKKLSAAVEYMSMDSVMALGAQGKKFIEESPELAAELLEEFQEYLDTAMTVFHVDSAYRDEFLGAFVSGFLAWDVLMYEAMNGTVSALVAAKAAISGNTPRNMSKVAANASRSRKLRNSKEANRAFRMPRDGDRGHWKNKETMNVWVSDVPEVNAITKGKGIHFVGSGDKKMPDFTPWSRGSVKFAKGALTGDDEHDFNLFYEKLAKRRGWKKSEARKYVKRNGLTLHHVGCNELQMVPTALHENVAHTGTASMIRNGLCAE